RHRPVGRRRRRLAVRGLQYLSRGRIEFAARPREQRHLLRLAPGIESERHRDHAARAAASRICRIELGAERNAAAPGERCGGRRVNGRGRRRRRRRRGGCAGTECQRSQGGSRTRGAHGGGYFTPRARPGTGLVLLARALATVFLRAAALAAARGLWPARAAGLARACELTGGGLPAAVLGSAARSRTAGAAAFAAGAGACGGALRAAFFPAAPSVGLAAARLPRPQRPKRPPRSGATASMARHSSSVTVFGSRSLGILAFFFLSVMYGP